MALQNSGPISLASIQAEFGGSAATSLSEYYAGGPYVPNPPPSSPFQSGPIPTSGAIALSMFYGVQKAPAEFVFNDIVTTSQYAGYNLVDKATAAGWNGIVKLLATVQVGSVAQGPTVYITNSWPNPAFTIPTLPTGSTMALTNYGIIIGSGGAGGYGGNAIGGGSGNGGAGTNGGPALIVNYLTTINNNGIIAGGGGGGGGGGGIWATYQPADTFDYNGSPVTPPMENYPAGGSGGGGGAGAGVGGVGGLAGPGGTYKDVNGYAGTGHLITSGSAGGAASENSRVVRVPSSTEVAYTDETVGGFGGFGGAGGDYGQPGIDGYGGYGGFYNSYQVAGFSSSEGRGGDTGAAITGGSNLRFLQNYGQILGTVDSYGTWAGNGSDFSSLMGNNKTSAFLQPYNDPGVSWTLAYSTRWYGGTHVAGYYGYNSAYPAGDFVYCALWSNYTSSDITAHLRGSVDDNLISIYVNGVSVPIGSSMQFQAVHDSASFTLPPGANVVQLILRNEVHSNMNAYGFALQLLDSLGAVLVPFNGWKFTG